jgi:hypothetical protein
MSRGARFRQRRLAAGRSGPEVKRSGGRGLRQIRFPQPRDRGKARPAKIRSMRQGLMKLNCPPEPTRRKAPRIGKPNLSCSCAGNSAERQRRMTRPPAEAAYSSSSPRTLPVLGLTRWTCRHMMQVTDS